MIPLSPVVEGVARTESRRLFDGQATMEAVDVGLFDHACPHCDAHKLESELRLGSCCNAGKLCGVVEPFTLPAEGTPARDVCDLWAADTREGRMVRKHARAFNNALAVTSLSVAQGAAPPGRAGWQPTFTLHGRMYSAMGALRPADGETPQFAQLYTIDPQHDGGTADEFRVKNVGFGTALKSAAEKELARQILRELDELLRQCNPYRLVDVEGLATTNPAEFSKRQKADLGLERDPAKRKAFNARYLPLLGV